MSDIRYGVYYLPPEGSPMAVFGATWLGWDVASGTAVPHPQTGLDLEAITSTPRKYGFHGTLKPPFRLSEGTDLAGLRAALGELATRHRPFQAATLELARLGSFLALVPSAACPALADLAGDCVQSLDRFRAPASQAELARRQAAGLDARQRELLERWGYPYVLDAFRFHLTLSGRLDETTATVTEEVLREITAGITQAPMPVQEICLVQQVDNAPFKLLHRYPLTG